jgi:hypothetical protein
MTDLIALQKIAEWEKLKTLVLDSVSSAITKRVYNMALDEFLAWFQHPPPTISGRLPKDIEPSTRAALNPRRSL